MKEKWKKIKTKIEYFWDYYKWFVIIPTVCVILFVSILTSYIRENREVALSVAIMNTSDTYDAEKAFSERYRDYRKEDIGDLPINVLTGFVHPKVMDEVAASDTYSVASIQKYQAMVTKGRVDVTVTTSWVIEEYQKSDVYYDLRELFSEDFLSRHEKDMIEVKDSKGEAIPVAFNIEECSLFGVFYEEGTPVLAVPVYTDKKEEAIRFIMWLMEDSGY